MFHIFSNGNTHKIIGVAVFILFSCLFFSCEKEVDIKLSDGEQRLVVEGAIETNLPPYVILTKSIGYFSKVDLNTLQNSFIHDAIVVVSDGVKADTLKEYTIDTANGARFFVYTVDTTRASSSWIVGQVGKSYKLSITTAEGKLYESITKIPNPTPLDSITTTDPPFIPKGDMTAKYVKIYFRDPDTLGNYMRYFTKRNDEPMFPGLNSVYPDEVINGKEFSTSLPAGENRNKPQNFDSLGYFHTGDTVIFKWCAIDKGVYDFYSTFEYSISTLGSPFASPIKVKSNISNNALGVWAGYGSIYTTIVIE